MQTLPPLLEDLPAPFWEVRWDGTRYPGAVPRDSWAEGANCHLFAYAVLAHFGHRVGEVRSAELWRDTDTTRVVLEPQPLDLALFHDNEHVFGAHVGVVVSPHEVLHLSKEVGRPAVWTFEQFAETPRFAHLIGFKRPLQQ